MTPVFSYASPCEAALLGFVSEPARTEAPSYATTQRAFLLAYGLPGGLLKFRRLPLVKQIMLVSVRQPEKRPELDLSKLQHTLGFLVRTLQVRSFRAFHAEFSSLGLTPARHAILTVIGSNPGIRQVQIASIFGLREPNMTKLVKEFESTGLIKRTRSREDGRAVGLTLSNAGKVFMAKIEQKSLEIDRQTVSSLTNIEVALLKQLLLKALTPLWGEGGVDNSDN